MNWKTYIHSDPKILLGKPVVKGTAECLKEDVFYTPLSGVEA
jgi:hypothetical protein